MSNELREFLASRRARITPEQAGLPRYGTHRRVAGLRREEVASLAGVSAEYYAKLERGTATGVSDSVLDAIARTLQLDEAERAHLYDLVRATTPAGRTRRRTVPSRVRPGVQQLLDAMTGIPAVVQNERFDVLATSPLGRALYADVFAGAQGSGRAPNLARFAFLDPRARDFYADWDRVASDAVALLRAAAGRSPDDRALSDLVGELTTRSDRFSTLWASYSIRTYPPGTKRFTHRLVGELELAYEAMDLTFDPGQVLVTYTAQPGSASQQALGILASWTSSDALPDPATLDAATQVRSRPLLARPPPTRDGPSTALSPRSLMPHGDQPCLAFHTALPDRDAACDHSRSCPLRPHSSPAASRAARRRTSLPPRAAAPPASPPPRRRHRRPGAAPP